jgi:flavorubredoxin
LYDVRYTPGEPIKSVDELGQEFGMSRSRTDQKLVLIFRVSKGVTINRYIIGNTSICLMDPTFPLIADQR